ncbi:hypothetical protein [Leptospira alstonii]|uniref:hypothetical protein n=1 Tax=Leptospira alstonii TaxID=28452 RepID=UPI0007730842|nr:hypothetical protein [Leptospira alstonii]
MGLKSYYRKNLRLYQLLITYVCIKMNAYSSFWFTALSSRDRYGSSLQFVFKTIGDIEFTAFFEGAAPNLNFSEYLHYKAIKEHLNKSNITICISFIRFLGLKLLQWKSNLLILKDFLFLIQELFFYFLYKKSYKLDLKNFSNGYLFVCPFDLPLLYNKNNEYKDRYFGEVPIRLLKKGKKVAITGILPKGVRDFYKRANLPKDIQLFPILFSVISAGLISVFKVIFMELFFPPKVKLGSKKIFAPFESIVNREIFSNFKNRVIGKLIFLSVESILENNSNISIIYTFENNFWEKALVQAFRKFSKSGKIIGYHHCAVLESHQKNYIDPIEFLKRPFPDRIFTTGPNSKEALLSIGRYPKGKVRAGVDLRGPLLNTITLKDNRPKKIQNILVILEGLNSMVALLNLILKVKDLESGLTFSVRPHPALDWSSQIMIDMEYKLKEKIVKLDPFMDLSEQIAKVDAVVYKGSTAALYAAYAGAPLLRYEDDWWLSDDPLFRIGGLKKCFRDEFECLQNINVFETMDDDIYLSLLKAQRNYIVNYLRPNS